MALQAGISTSKVLVLAGAGQNHRFHFLFGYWVLFWSSILICFVLGFFSLDPY